MERADLFNGSVTNYTLDNADRLTGIHHSADGQTLADYQYTLDNNGNRIKALVLEPKKPEALINRSQGHTYNAPKNRLLNTQLNGTTQATFSYDHEGRQQKKNSTHFTFDHAHRLIQRGNDHYVYDGMSNRIRATRNGQDTKYIYDAAGNLLAEANNSNQITRYYIYGQGLLGFIDAQTNLLYTYHFDGTGHTVAITDQNQNTVNTYAYDPYGRQMAQSETIAQPFKYAGQFGVQAEENNLYYMSARYYDADIGRFISEDPIGFEGGLNLYAYAGGNPVMFVDPSGFAATEGASQAFSYLNRTLTGIGGAGQLLLGGSICSTVVGCTAGVPIMTLGLSNIQEALTGGDGFARTAFQSVLGKRNGDLALGTANLGTSIYGLSRPVISSTARPLFVTIPSDYVPAYKSGL